MTTYPFRQGIDYGARRGTLGLAFHMAEGGDGTLPYLAKRPTETVAQWKVRVRGVSANAVILTDGTVWNMVDWTHASGSMNPNDRNPATTGYYNGTVIKDVLGAHYVDPNAYSISVEICGFRAQGPTPAQVKGAIAWGRDMRSRFPTIRGAYGHHDQTDTKGCPGTTAAMKAIFEGVGGHGLFTEEPEMTNYRAVGEDWKPSVRSDASDAPIRLTPDRAAPIAVRLPAGTILRTVAEFEQDGEKWRVTRLSDGRTGFIIRGDLVPLAVGGDPAVDAPFVSYVQRQPVTPSVEACKPLIDKAIVADRAKAKVVWL